MPTKLIRLDNGPLIEVEASPDEVQAISGGDAESVSKDFYKVFAKIRPTLLKVCKPLADTWKELNQDMVVEQAEVELGFSFEGEGNLYITKATAGANLTVKLTLKPKE